MRKEDYTVGWICALPVPEWQASRLLLDEEHNDLPLPNAKYQYVFGKMHGHNIVMGCLPDTQMGTSAAAGVAAEMASIFPALRFGLLVGVGGGVWSERHDIRLGDVVVSRPDKDRGTGGVVQYDYGKAIQGGGFEAIGMLNQPPINLLAALGKVRSTPLDRSKFPEYLEAFERFGDESPEFTTRPKAADRLFQATYAHPQKEPTCWKCDSSQEVERRERAKTQVHYGTIASGNQVMKDAQRRDEIVRDHEILCFEMEAAGLMNQFPCLVIRGICDYCDSHKNKAWQPYAAAVAAAWAKELLRNVSSEAVAGQQIIKQQAKQAFTVPFARDAKFVGRQDILDKIDVAFSQKDSHNSKSQIAIEYSYRYRGQHPRHSVFWVHASNKARFIQAYQEIARLLEIPGCQDPRADVLELVRSWLSKGRNGCWLMIIDNADDPGVLFPQESEESSKASEDQDTHHPLSFYIPQSEHGAVLITSRNQTGADLAENSEHEETVGPFNKDTAMTLLKNKFPKLKANEVDADAVRLLELLDYIPLAIAQAAAYMQKRKMTASKYYQLFKESEHNQAQMLGTAWHTIQRDPSMPNAVITSWKVSFDQIRQTSQLAADLLSLLGMLDRQGIPESLLSLKNATELETAEAVGLLQEYSMVSKEKDGASYSMHRLVQTSTRAWLQREETLEHWEGEAVALLAKQFPWGDFDNWSACKVLLPHAQKVMEYGTSSLAAAELLHNLGWYTYLQGRAGEAQTIIERALAISERQRGYDHPSTLYSVENLAIVYEYQGRHSEAEPLYERALMAGERQLGTNHPETLKSVINLAGLYGNQGRYGEAEALYGRALEGNERQLGPDHPNTLHTMQNLAGIYDLQGQYGKAEALSQRALAGIERLSGPGHLNTLRMVITLAGVYRNQRRYGEAETLFERGLAGLERQLGLTHPTTLRAAGSLTRLYYDQGRYSEAEPLVERRLVEGERQLGPNHPVALRAAEDLALLRRRIARSAQTSSSSEISVAAVDPLNEDDASLRRLLRVHSADHQRDESGGGRSGEKT